MDRDFQTPEEEDGARMNVASIQSHSPIFAVAGHICSFPFLFQDLCNRFAALAITDGGSAKATDEHVACKLVLLLLCKPLQHAPTLSIWAGNY